MRSRGEEFFDNMTQISDFIFDLVTSAWGVIQDNWILSLSFAITLVSGCVIILRRIKNIKG